MQTDEGFSILAPMNIYCYDIKIPKEVFIYVAKFGTPGPPHNIDGVKEGIIRVLLSESWEIQLRKPELEMTPKWQAKKIVYQLGGGLECRFEKYAAMKPIVSLQCS